ncbi:PREDICTED: LOW QUALITY PROTEIN: ankyrin repeat domain-containing protein 26-like, partial [Galeopterus variegatus]|uniref:LOW QUALITY PROTEIN: ankyrin repeat domain-containing protein 26-like n=1 Tax=Galeopterus variegatus TaxID=482537 RepID=A0ABM0QHY4_GALVR
MNRLSGVLGSIEETPSSFSTNWKSSSDTADTGWLRKKITHFRLRYQIKLGRLGKIHHAARKGDVERIQMILLYGEGGVDDRDRNEKTPLHWACTFGHREVVALLVEKRCNLNPCDDRKKTALMKAVQCQNEECVAILLEHGANPCLTDSRNNTALHYAACGQNVSIAEKLLLHHANIEARNKKGLTPLLLALKRNRPSMVEFLVKNGADIHAVDIMERTALMFAVTHESTNIVKLLLERGIDIASEDIYERTAEFYAIVSGNHNISENLPQEHAGHVFGTADQRGQNVVNGQVAVPKSALRLGQEEQLQSRLHFEEKATKPSVGTKENDMKSALRLGPEKDEESPWDSESISENLPQKCADHVSGAADQIGKNKVNGEVEDMFYIPSCMSGPRNFKIAKLEDTRSGVIPVAHVESAEKYPHLQPTTEVKDSVPNKVVGVKDIQTSRSAEQDFRMTADKEQERLDGNENKQPQVDEEKKHKSNKTKISENLYDGAAAAAADNGLIQQRKNGRTDHQQFPIEENEGYDRSPALHMMEGKKNENEKWTSKESVITPTFEKADSLTGGPLQVNVNSCLGKIDQDDGRMYRLFFNFKENCDMSFYLVLAEGLLCFTQVSDSHQKDLLHKNHMLQDELAMLRLERDRIKNQFQEKENKHFKDIGIIQRKNEYLQKMIKWNEETSTKTISQYSGHLNVLRAENAMLNSKLEDAKQNNEKLETDIESYRSRLAA